MPVTDPTVVEGRIFQEVLYHCYVTYFFSLRLIIKKKLEIKNFTKVVTSMRAASLCAELKSGNIANLQALRKQSQRPVIK